MSLAPSVLLRQHCFLARPNKSEVTIHWDLIRYFLSEVSVDGLHLSGSKAGYALCLIKMTRAVFPVQKSEHRSVHHPTWRGEGSLVTHTCLTDPIIRHQLNVPPGDHVSHQDVRER